MSQELTFTVGQTVRVKTSVVVYHHPQHKGKPYDLAGQTGEVVEVIEAWQGRPLTANLPVVVKFDGRFKAHLETEELELVV
ncbi:ferredoxin thioredoxin reductase alpha [Gloeomargarita lithophora Alchichica-D10]|uniref:Ferredoxin thioredoxin reductase alpha n=1 Tax=Gloeomargarita lithophora Alchichica-D10 TaxID=1188229 RepID=A0A1J0A9S4_9CYAN|nr:ferredoxin-thioredoxin reductase variable chain [Gloeomargarita lithophora]APB32678.1 ferredoxin thioredoxin reductase alpha [Gloeomargarita lithophora Alchichica-D10]